MQAKLQNGSKKSKQSYESALEMLTGISMILMGLLTRNKTWYHSSQLLILVVLFDRIF
jgi:hypothetical protein